ncbi:MAG: elongation factor G, partial [Planctomycetota bacterium]
MAAVSTSDIRNVALAGHAGAGKTTLAEQLLHTAGVIGKVGSVEKGDTTADFEAEEKEHQHSLTSALLQFEHNGARVNLIDTPGYPDFVGSAITALPAVEVAMIVVDAARGVQSVTRRIARLAEERRLPTMFIVNKIDAPEADLPGVVAALQETFGAKCVPMNLPTGGGSGVIDCIAEDSGDADFSTVAEAHTAIVDQIVEVDDALMEAYLETGEPPAPDQRRDAFRRALRESHLSPVAFVSARTGAGVAELLAVIEDFCPSPLEGNPRPFVKDGEPFEPTPDPAEPLVAHVFKVSTDPFVGKLAYFRVHQGTLGHNSQVFRNDEKKAVRIGHISRTLGKDHTEVDAVVAGDIGAVAKVEDLRLNDVLHDDHALDSVRFSAIPLPRPMYGLAITPKSRGDESKLGAAVAKLMDEDPTFVVERVEATRQTVARAVGELHMRVMLEKLKNRFNVEVETETPRVPYKETITGKAEGHHRHKKQTGGAGQFGEVFLRVEPLPADHETGFEFVDDTFGGSVPKQFMPAIEKGVRQAMATGVIAGYPFGGVRVSVYDGKHHPVDSKEVAFITAGKRAFIDAVTKAKPALLEPFVEMEITAPADNMGDISADLSGKRGRIQGSDMLPGGMCLVRAIVPLSEVRNYSSQLKSITGGQGSYTMDYSHDEPCPANVQAEVVAAYKPKDEED